MEFIKEDQKKKACLNKVIELNRQFHRANIYEQLGDIQLKEKKYDQALEFFINSYNT
jgi:hypothetical protein